MPAASDRTDITALSRRRALLALILCGILCTAALTGKWDSHHRPRPAAVDLSDAHNLPSVVPYIGTRVTISGPFVADGGGSVRITRPKVSEWRHDSWFLDASDSISLTLPIHVPPEADAIVTGILSATPAGPGSSSKAMSLNVDTVHYDTHFFKYDTPVPFSLREELDSLSTGIMVIAAVLFPVWLRNILLLISPRITNCVSHRCPCCGYDCRGSPHRCPECGTRMQSPNFRLDLNPKT
jgi:hypothetical protein